MAFRCDICEKGSDSGHKVSHAKNRTKTRRKPNLHRATIIVKGKKVKGKFCTKCLRAAERPAREVKKKEEKKSKKK